MSAGLFWVITILLYTAFAQLDCGYTSTDFYYRAVPARILNVIYYTPDHTNILTNEKLLEIKNIEQQIKSWPGYHNHSQLYREKDWVFEFYFKESILYCESPTYSPLNFIFAEEINFTVFNADYYMFNGNGSTVNNDWKRLLFVSNDWDSHEIGQGLWFNRDTFTSENGYTSPYLGSLHLFGYQDADETSDDLDAFVATFDELLNQYQSSESMSVSWVYDKSADQYTINDKLFTAIPTVQPTFAPTIDNNDTDSDDPPEFKCPTLELGYQQSTGESIPSLQYGSISYYEPLIIPSYTDIEITECGQVLDNVFVSDTKETWFRINVALDEPGTIEFTVKECDDFVWNLAYQDIDVYQHSPDVALQNYVFYTQYPCAVSLPYGYEYADNYFLRVYESGGTSLNGSYNVTYNCNASTSEEQFSGCPSIYYYEPYQRYYNDFDCDVDKCRGLLYTKYQATDNDIIYYENNSWHMTVGDNEYFCAISYSNVELCDNQWQDINTGEYASSIYDGIPSSTSPGTNDESKGNKINIVAMYLGFVCVMLLVEALH